MLHSFFVKILYFVLTFAIFYLAKSVNRIKLFKKLPPILLSSAVIILLLRFFNIEFSEYNTGAKYVTFLLGPATIALAYPLIKISMLPKSVTTPIAVEISKTTGGIPELTACAVIFTGIFGAIFGRRILKLFNIDNDVAIGLSVGAASHVMGTSSLAERKKFKQVAISTVALTIVAILTAIFIPVLLKIYSKVMLLF